MTGWGSVRAVRAGRGQAMVAFAIVAMLTISGCGGKSDDKTSSSSSKSASASTSAKSSPSPSGSLASAQVPQLSGPLPTECLSDKQVSKDFGFSMTLLATTPAGGVLECKYLSTKPQRALIVRMSNIKADQASGSYGRIANNYAVTLKTKGEDADVGTESRIFQTRPFNAALVAHDADGTTVIMTFISPGANKLRPKFLQVATDVMKKY